MLAKDLERLNSLEFELKEKNKRVQQLEEMINQKNEQLVEYRDANKDMRAWKEQHLCIPKEAISKIVNNGDAISSKGELIVLKPEFPSVSEFIKFDTDNN